MSTAGMRFDRGYPIAVAREDDDPEAYVIDEDPEPDVVWDIVDAYSEWFQSVENAEAIDDAPVTDAAAAAPTEEVS